MGNCCKSEGETIVSEPDNYGDTYTCNQNNHEDVFKTRPPCWYGHQCPCVCHHQGGSCIFKLKPK